MSNEAVCTRCNDKFLVRKGFITRCSIKCRSSRHFSDVSRRKKSTSAIRKWNLMGEDEKTLHISRFQTADGQAKRAAARALRHKNTPWNDLGWESKRKRVIEEQAGKCNKCGIGEWLGVPIVLEIDHKDGISDNNARDNLEGLCPNCHSITPSWRGRNKPVATRSFLSDEALTDILLRSPSIRVGLLAAGMAAKGKNYERAKRLLEAQRKK